MRKKYVLFLFPFLILFCCDKDDGVTPLLIETNADEITVVQNLESEIFIFANDLYIPTSGTLTISNPSKGNAFIIDLNNTPNNPSDDFIKYIPNSNTVGTDNFEYTICTNSGDCATESVTINIISSSNVLFDLEGMPFQSLSDYGFFVGDLKNLEPTFGVLPYDLNSALFSDYSKKKRFIWMPNNSKATFVSDAEILDFPVGTIIIKSFYYDNVLPANNTQIIETRLLIKKETGWIFANYTWNAEQLDATLDMNGSFVDVQWQQNNEVKSVQYRIPSGAECHTCHKVMEVSKPIGPKPRNLNLTYNYDDGADNQLDKWVSIGYLENTLPDNIATMPNYYDTGESLENRVRAYVDINCAHCHSEETHCAYRPLRLDYSDTDNLTNMGVCVDADTDLGFDLGHIVEPGDARNSVLHYRLNSTETSNRMPLLSRSIVHVEGVELIEAWINSLDTNCN
ncbi:MAG: hypothetical protein AB8B52_03155 [Winogradskyella sp.]|uniref:Ig-like domain-containing protein n=1 Tax=Winogradskyella sp. TaxID=1883156 RepID=UPI00385C9539